MPVIQNLDRNRKFKMYSIIFAAVVIVLILIWVILIKNKPSVPADQSQTKTGDIVAEKQKAMLEAIQKANENAPALSEEELVKKQQEMTDAINTANKDAPLISDEEKAKHQKEMLEAINAANQ